jgi:uncharacterized repeat protein (TIGR04138 family)
MSEPSPASYEEVIRRDGRYPLEAFAFLHESMALADRQAYGDIPAEPGVQRHVTVQQVCLAARELAVRRWGQLAGAVLARWNIRGTIDFGEMIFLLIEHGLAKKTDQDKLEDARNVYDFSQAFDGEDFELKE